MILKKQTLSIGEVRKQDLVNYLSSLGHQPVKISREDYWYLSPLRREKTASFKVNRKLNVWYDHGFGKRGNLIDFTILKNNCTIADLLKNFRTNPSLHQPTLPPICLGEEHVQLRIKVIQEKPLGTFSLYQYLNQRRTSYDLEQQYCKEVIYELKGKKYLTIGFKNSSGGYELRNPHIKLSSSPKDVTTITNKGSKVCVFEGFIDFLSFATMQSVARLCTYSYVILNAAFFLKSPCIYGAT